MEHYAGLDVSLELTSVCIVDAQGAIIRETKVANHPEDHLRRRGRPQMESGRGACPSKHLNVVLLPSFKKTGPAACSVEPVSPN